MNTTRGKETNMKTPAVRMAEQMRCPRGLWGGFAASIMKRYNEQAEVWTVEQLQVGPADCVLEIGFGPGLGLRQVLKGLSAGNVYGIDMSPRMVRMASRTNFEALQSGKLQLQIGSADHLPYKDAMFDKVFAVNVVYFWNKPRVELIEIKRTLKNGGLIALYVVEKNDLQKMRQARTDVFRLRDTEEIAKMLEEVGLKNIKIEHRKERIRTGVCISAAKTW
jgi:SAM-dependent methyltransferase